METGTNPKFIGRSDKADFAKINLKRVRVKIDSGAYTSAIHCCNIEETRERKLKVIFLDPDDPKYTGKIHIFKKYFKTSVKSSNGETEERFVITTQICFHRRIYRASETTCINSGNRQNIHLTKRTATGNIFFISF